MNENSILTYQEEIAKSLNEIEYLVLSFLPVLNDNIAQIENQYVNPTDTEKLILYFEGLPIIGDMILALQNLSGAITALTTIGVIKWLSNKTGKNILGINDNQEKNITVNCECHCDCCCGGDDDPEGEKVPAVETSEVKELEGQMNFFPQLEGAVEGANSKIVSMGKNFATAMAGMATSAKVAIPEMSSMLSKSLVATLVLVAAQALETGKITDTQFSGMANSAKISNTSMLADATSTYGKYLMEIENFFKVRLSLYSKNEKIINGVISSEGKISNKLNEENLLKYNGTTTKALAQDIAIYNKLGAAIEKIVLENGKKINTVHGTALKGYSKTTSTELAVDYAVYKKIGSEILKLLGTNGKTANANNKSALGQLNKQTAEALNQEIALYKKIENQLNQMQKKSSKTVNTTHNEGLLSYLGDTKAHLAQEMHQWDTHGKYVIGTNKRIITSITGIHASGLSKFAGELLNPLATIERLWNTHGQRVTASNKNTMNSVNSNTFTGLNTLEGTVQDSGQKIEGSVSTTGNNSARKIAGTVGNINQSFQGAGATWGQSLKGSLNYLEGVVDSWGPKILSAFKYVWKPVQDFLGSVAKVTAPLLPVEEGVSEAFAVEPTKSTWDISRLRGANFNGNEFALDRSGDVNVVINSPKALNPFEVRRQMEKMSRNMANGFY